MPDVLETPWTLKGTTGSFSSPGFEAVVDVCQPQRGLLRCAVDGNSTPGTFLSIARDRRGHSIDHGRAESDGWPLSVCETYVRGGDLVATYSPVEDWPYAPQIYWRAGQLDAVENVRGSLALLISVQTDLLDTHPHINVVSQIEAEEVLQVALVDELRHRTKTLPQNAATTVFPENKPCCLVWRLKNSRLSYAEIMHASDFRQLDVRLGAKGSTIANWCVFADFLEKGVIWRARLQSAFLPRERDIELAAACCRSLERRPPPLTA